MSTAEILALIDGLRSRGVTSFRHVQEGSDLAFSLAPVPVAAPSASLESTDDTLSVTAQIDRDLFGQEL